MVSRSNLEGRRQTLRGRLLHHGPSPGNQQPPDAPEDAIAYAYRSGELELQAYVLRPSPQMDAPFPAILYSHGGCSLSQEDFEAARLFVDRGILVLLPTYRGEHGNPGSYELFLGEVDDARAAIEALAGLSDVDEERLYAFGYSMGGEIAALLSLPQELSLRATGSCGPFFLRRDPFSGESMYGAPVPFDPIDREDVEARLLRTHLGEMVIPHMAFIGREDEKFSDGAWRLFDVHGAKLTVTEVPGTHDSSLLPAVRAFLNRIARR